MVTSESQSMGAHCVTSATGPAHTISVSNMYVLSQAVSIDNSHHGLATMDP